MSSDPSGPVRDLLRFATAGSVDDGKSTLVGRLLYDTKSVLADQIEAVHRASVDKGLSTPDLSLLVDGPTAVADGLAAFGWQAGVSTLYTAGLASLVGYGIFNTLLSRNPSAAVVPWVLLAPVVAMASAALLLDQLPNAAEAGGGAVMVLGVLVALRSGGVRRVRTSVDDERRDERLRVKRAVLGRALRAFDEVHRHRLIVDLLQVEADPDAVRRRRSPIIVQDDLHAAASFSSTFSLRRSSATLTIAVIGSANISPRMPNSALARICVPSVSAGGRSTVRFATIGITT